MKLTYKNLIPLIVIILLIASIGSSGYSAKITVHGFKIFIPELILFVWALIGIPYLLSSRRSIDRKYLLLALMVLGLMAVSSVFSIQPVVSFKETLRWGEIFSAFFLAAHLVRRPVDVKVILLVIILMGIFQSLWGMKLLSDTGLSGGLVTPYFDNPNQMGLYLDFSLPLIAAFLFGTKDIWWRIWWAYCFLLIGLGLCLTRSRGALISNGIVIVLFSLIFLYQRTGKSIFMDILRRVVCLSFWGLTFLFFAFFLLVAFAPGLTERLLKETESGRANLMSSRLYFYVTGYQIIEDFPLTGVGGNLYREVAPYYIPYYAPKEYHEELKKYHLHNLYLKMAAENGLLTLLAFLFLLYSVAKDMFRSFFVVRGENYWLLAGAGGSAMAWLLHNIVDEGFSFVAIQLGIFLGLIVSMKKYEFENGNQENDKSL